MGMFTQILEVLDTPSNALQGLVVDGVEGFLTGLKQEKDYQFKDAFSEEFLRDKPRTAEVLGTTLDFVVDPLNLLGIGMLSKGSKAVSSAIDSGANISRGAMKGIYPSSVPNYIQGHYGPTQQALVKAQALKSKLKAAKTPKIEIDKAVNNLLRTEKGKGFVKTASEGAKNAIINSLSPEARALYRSTGINRPLYSTERLSPKALNTELIHRSFANRHIGKQAGRTGDTKEIDNLMSKGFYTDYIPLKKGVYGESAKEFSKGKYAKEVSDADYTFIQKHFSDVWKDKKITDKVTDKLDVTKRKKVSIGESSNPFLILKKPQSNVTGNHWNDMVNSPEISALATSFALGKKVPKNPKDLAKYLKNQGFDNKLTVDKDGVWFSYSRSGSSITEGGVNFLVKIKPNGRLTGVMSDEHNFLEFLPGTDKFLPNRVVAVTPPMTGNIRTMRPKQSGSKRKLKTEDKKQVNQQIPKALNDLLGATPTTADLAFEKGRALQKLGFASTASGFLSDTE